MELHVQDATTGALNLNLSRSPRDHKNGCIFTPHSPRKKAYLIDWSGGRSQRTGRRARTGRRGGRLRLESRHGLRHAVGENKLFPQLNVGATFGYLCGDRDKGFNPMLLS